MYILQEEKDKMFVSFHIYIYNIIIILKGTEAHHI